MKYYIDGIDPDGGPYCAPDHGARRRLTLPDSYHLVELAPTLSLFQSWSACQQVLTAIRDGSIKGRDKSSIDEWATDLNHKTTILRVITFLGGRRLEEIPDVFDEKYTTEINRSQTWAARSWVSTDMNAEFISNNVQIVQILRRETSFPL